MNSNIINLKPVEFNFTKQVNKFRDIIENYNIRLNVPLSSFLHIFKILN